jgi:S-adenosylhomocysteine hydrolase
MKISINNLKNLKADIEHNHVNIISTDEKIETSAHESEDHKCFKIYTAYSNNNKKLYSISFKFCDQKLTVILYDHVNNDKKMIFEKDLLSIK